MKATIPGKRHEISTECAVCQRNFVTLHMVNSRIKQILSYDSFSRLFHSHFVIKHNLRKVLFPEVCEVRYSSHLFDAIDRGSFILDKQTIQKCLFVQVSTDYIDEDGNWVDILEWELYLPDYVDIPHGRNCLIIKGVPKLYISPIYNRCPIYIQGIQEAEPYLYLNKASQITKIEYLGGNSYQLDTAKGVFIGKYTSDKFIKSLTILLKIYAPEGDRYEYYLFEDGAFTKRKIIESDLPF